jgi:hypothetical protein
MIRLKVGRPIIMPVIEAGRPWQHYFGIAALMCGLFWFGHYFVKEIHDHPDERTPLKIIALTILSVYVWYRHIAPELRRPRRERIRFL